MQPVNNSSYVTEYNDSLKLLCSAVPNKMKCYIHVYRHPFCCLHIQRTLPEAVTVLADRNNSSLYTLPGVVIKLTATL